MGDYHTTIETLSIRSNKQLVFELGFWHLMMGLVTIAFGNWLVSLRSLIEGNVLTLTILCLNLLITQVLMKFVSFWYIRIYLKRDIKLSISKYGLSFDGTEEFYTRRNILLFIYLPVMMITLYTIVCIVFFPLKFFWCFFVPIVLQYASFPSYFYITRKLMKQPKSLYYRAETDVIILYNFQNNSLAENNDEE